MTNHTAITVRIEDIPTAVARIKAATLRELADLWYSDEGPDNPLSAASWLRARADQIEAQVRHDAD